jgi:hypothetical protein
MNEGRDLREEHFSRFVQRVWTADVAPLLRGRLAEQRKTGARWGGTTAAAGGALLDGLLRLRGRPFTRAMTVLGSTLGAMVPDLWDWEWLRRSAGDQERRVLDEQVRRRAAELPEDEALSLFDLPASATIEELRHAWRAMSLRWHPDKAPDEARRREYEVRFVTYQSAYNRLSEAFDAGRLPRKATG